MKQAALQIIIFVLFSYSLSSENVKTLKDTKAKYSIEVQNKITSFESVLFHDFSISPYLLDFAEKRKDRYVAKKNLSLNHILASSGTTLLMFESEDDIMPVWYFDRSGERVDIHSLNTGVVLFSGGSKNHYLPVYFNSFNDEKPGFFRAYADNSIQKWRLNKGSSYSEPLYVSGVLVTGIGLGSMLWGFVSLFFKPEKPDEIVNSDNYAALETQTAQRRYDEQVSLWKKNILTNEVAGLSAALIGVSLTYYGIKLRPNAILIEKKF